MRILDGHELEMSDKTDKELTRPEILAPAGSKAAFLAALAAGADAVYCGLKRYSARMAATNFSVPELAGLTRLAHERGVRVYVTVNTLIKPDEVEDTARLLDTLAGTVRPDALILQDLAVVELARRVGFFGELHLSTLDNAGLANALPMLREKLGINRVVVPRELNIDEIRMLDQACPEGLGLEAFIHGALCYAVSGRCYWSSYMGGKSGLRGRCVQPCRRWYRQGEERHRAFSCQDLSIDVLVKVLRSVKSVRAWKIEGRKKGPHYVYYTVSAYKLLRDEGDDPKAKRTALEQLAYSLGRSGTHYNFLPQRPQHPVQKTRQTGSGLFVGRVRSGRVGAHITPREALLAGDALRIGYEDEPWHTLIRVRRGVPKKGNFKLPLPKGKQPPAGTAVFLTDRIEPALAEKIEALDKSLDISQEQRTDRKPSIPVRHGSRPKRRKSPEPPVRDMTVSRQFPLKRAGNIGAIWLSEQTLKAAGKEMKRLVWWLPPVIWPEGEERLADQVFETLKRGAKRFVLNSPWQIAFFADNAGVEIWAGPFCNLANPLSLETAADLGFSGAILSPELGKDHYLTLPDRSPLPLGMVISGNYPLCISRIGPESIDPGRSFASPRGEAAWTVRHGDNFWTYPNWPVDLTAHRQRLERAGYRLFVHLSEPIPQGVAVKRRPGTWNWDHGLA